jgi:hypothetical protein
MRVNQFLDLEVHLPGGRSEMLEEELLLAADAAGETAEAGRGGEEVVDEGVVVRRRHGESPGNALASPARDPLCQTNRKIGTYRCL